MSAVIAENRSLPQMVLLQRMMEPQEHYPDGGAERGLGAE